MTSEPPHGNGDYADELPESSDAADARRAAEASPMFDPYENDPAVLEPFGDDRDALAARAALDSPPRLVAALDAVDAFLCRFVHFEHPAQRTAVVLWVAATYLTEQCGESFGIAPYLHIKSPEKQSGKTLLLEILELLTADAMFTMNISPAALYRVVDAKHPTLLFDEIDAIFTGRKGDGREELRGLINAGYRSGAKVHRTAGPRHDRIEAFDVFGPKALAGIGELPDTIADRAIPIRLQRKPRSVKLERWRRRHVTPEANTVADGLDLVLVDAGVAIATRDPALPDELSDRAQDLWEPLLAIADHARGDWPERARAAAVHLHTSGDQAGETIGVRLLADCRDVFGDDELLWTSTLLERLCDRDEAPWADWYGKPITARFLAEKLRPYGIHSQNVRLPEGQKKGYTRASFTEAWNRYLPDPTPPPSQPPQTSPDTASRPESLPSHNSPGAVPKEHGTSPGRTGTAPQSGDMPTATTNGTAGTEDEPVARHGDLRVEGDDAHDAAQLAPSGQVESAPAPRVGGPEASRDSGEPAWDPGFRHELRLRAEFPLWGLALDGAGSMPLIDQCPGRCVECGNAVDRYDSNGRPWCEEHLVSLGRTVNDRPVQPSKEPIVDSNHQANNRGPHDKRRGGTGHQPLPSDVEQSPGKGHVL